VLKGALIFTSACLKKKSAGGVYQVKTGKTEHDEKEIQPVLLGGVCNDGKAEVGR